MTFPDGWQVKGSQLARVRSLLGKPYELVLDTYQKAYDASEPGKWRCKVASQAGWFIGASGHRELARQWFDKAIEEEEKDTRFIHNPPLAQKGLELLRQQMPFYPPSF